MDTPQMKRCNKCGEMKPLNEFTRDRKRKDGLNLYCRNCKRSPATMQRLEEKAAIPEGCKQCAMCKEIKPFETFSRSKGRKDGRHSYCKNCGQTPAGKAQKADKASWPSDHKRCCQCKEVKPFAAFHRRERAKDGLAYQCKVCEASNGQTSYLKHRQKRLDYQAAYKVAHPERIIAYKKALYAATKEEDNAKSKAWREMNLEYARAKSRENYAKNSPRIKASIREWCKANPDKVAARRHTRRTQLIGNGGYFTDKDLANMRHIQGGHCCYCGRLGLSLEIDHIHPVTQGGPSDPWNLALCCKRCNSSKNDRTLEQWWAAGCWYLPKPKTRNRK